VDHIHSLGFDLDQPIKDIGGDHYKVLAYGEINAEIDYSSLRRDTYTLSKNIIDYFDLGPDEYPCILVLTRNSPDKPLILSLKEENNQEYILQFFSELAKLVRKNNSWSARMAEFLKIPATIDHKKNDRLSIQQNLIKVEDRLQSKTIDAQNLFDSFQCKIGEIGVPSHILDSIFKVQPSHNFAKLLGIENLSVPSPGILPFQDKLKSAYKNALKPILKDLNKTQKDIQTLKHTLHQMRLRIREMDREIETLEVRYHELKRNENEMIKENEEIGDDVKHLINRFNLKFNARDKYKRVKEFVEEIISWVKFKKEIIKDS
jgi:hypothetical protein